MWLPRDSPQMMVWGCLAIALMGAAAVSASAGVWTNLRPDLTRCKFEDVCFVDPLRGWAVGTPGYVVRTTDGGSSWSDPVWICNQTLDGVDFVDSLRGWAVDSPGARIFHTTDGGKVWCEQPNSVNGALTAVDFVDSLHGWAVGWKVSSLPATILRTTNGGETWIDESPGLKCWMEDVCFVDTLWGWVVAQNDTPNVMRSTNGGKDWYRLDPGTTRSLRGVDFLNRDEGWVVGEIDSVFHTTDGGDSWQGYHVPQEDGFRDLWFLNPMVGWAVGGTYYTGGRHLFKTTNGGVSWSESQKENNNRLYAVTFSHPRNGVAVGEFSTILHSTDGGGSWSNAVEPTNDLLDLAWLDGDRGWCVGANGAILHTRDGGQSWEWQESEVDAYLLGVSFVDSLHGWAVGGPPAVVLHTVDGGKDWEPQPIGAENELVDVGFIDTQLGWVIEQGDPNPARLHRTTTGGESWETFEPGEPIGWLYGGDFLSADTAWIVGETGWPTYGGIIRRTTNGGTGWPVCYQGGPLLSAVQFATPDSGWAVGYGGTIVRTTDAGESWESTEHPGTSWLYDVSFLDSRRGWAVGSGTGGGCIHTTDGGETWASDSVAGESWGFRGVAFLDAEHGWSCGRWGTIWRYDSQVNVNEKPVGCQRRGARQIPKLRLCGPNPFHSSITLGLTIPGDADDDSQVRLAVYNIMGQTVATLLEEVMHPGEYRIGWDGNEGHGGLAGSGVYLIRLEVESAVQTRKVVLLR